MRRQWLDNIRWFVVAVVVVYHIIYMFNSVGVINNTGVSGIAWLDAFLYFVYPWLMASLFVVAGMGARYSLEKRSGRQFAGERAKRLLIPSIAGIFLVGWINGYVTNMYGNLFPPGELPGVIQYIIYCLIGMGPLWFAHELFLASMILLLIRAVDRQDKLWKLAGRATMPIILLLFFSVWGSSYLFLTPVIEVYRNGIYVFMFLLGYFIFSHERVTDLLVTFRIPLLVAALACGVTYTAYYYGVNYTARECLQSPFTNLYLWLAILAMLGCFKAWFHQSNRFTGYMNTNCFGIYMLHYPILVLAAYLLEHFTNLSMIVIYLLLLLIGAAVVPGAVELVRRIPVIRFLLLGENGRR